MQPGGVKANALKAPGAAVEAPSSSPPKQGQSWFTPAPSAAKAVSPPRRSRTPSPPRDAREGRPYSSQTRPTHDRMGRSISPESGSEHGAGPAHRPRVVPSPPAFADAAKFMKTSNDILSGNMAGARRRRANANIFQGMDLRSASAEEVPILIRAALRPNLARVVDAFRHFDDDMSGVIDKKEFAKGLREMGLTAPDVVMNSIFHSFDADGSGQVSYGEMDRLLRRSAQRVSSPDAKGATGARRRIKKASPSVKKKPTAKAGPDLAERPKWDSRTRVVHNDEIPGTGLVYPGYNEGQTRPSSEDGSPPRQPGV